MMVLFFLVVILVFWVEGVPLIKKGLWRELGAVSFLIAAAIFLGIAKIMEISPVRWLHQLLGPVGEVIFKTG